MFERGAFVPYISISALANPQKLIQKPGNPGIQWHITALKPVCTIRRIKPLSEKRTNLRSPKLLLSDPRCDILNFGPDLTNIKVCMCRTVAAMDIEQFALASAIAVLVKAGAHGYTIAALLAHGVQKVVQRLLVPFDVLHLSCAHGITMAVELSVLLQLGTAHRGVEIVDRLAVGEFTAGDKRLELTCFAKVFWEANFLACNATPLCLFVPVARVDTLCCDKRNDSG